MKLEGEKKTIKILFYLVFVLCFLEFPIGFVKAQEQRYQLPERPLRIAVLQNNPPFSLKLPSGKLVGLYIDIWDLWSEQTGIPIEYHAGEYGDNVASLRNGLVDFQSGLFMNEERRQWADFSIPIHRVTTNIFVRTKVEKRISIEDFYQKKIAVGTDSYQQHYLKKYHPSIKVLDFKDPKQSILSLIEGRVDAVVSEEPFIDAQLSMMGIKGALSRSREPFLVNTVHALIPKDKPGLTQIINQGLSKIPKKLLVKVEKKWLPGYNSYFESEAFGFLRGLTFEQQLWLRRHSQINNLFKTDFAPIEFLSKQRVYSGISSEYTHLLSKKLDINIISKPRKLVSKNQSTVIETDVIYTSVQSNDISYSDLVKSDPYAQFPVVIVSRKDSVFISSLDDLLGKRVGVGSIGKIANDLQLVYPTMNLVFFPSVSLALDKLEEGQIDVYIDNLALVSYSIKSSNRNQIKIASPTPYFIDFSFGVKKELEPLVNIINKLLASIDRKTKNKLENNWLDYQIKQNPRYQKVLGIAVPSIFLLGLFILFVFYSNKMMRREIESRLAMEEKLSSETDKAEKANRAKDEFLANMSHEIRTPMNTIVGLVELLTQTKLDKEQSNYINTLTNSTNSLQYLIEDILDLSDIVNQELKLNIQAFELEELVLSIIDQANFRAKSAGEEIPIIHRIDPKIPKFLKGDPVRLGQILLNLLSNAIKFTPEGRINISIDLKQMDRSTTTIQFEVKDTGIGMSEEQRLKLFQTYSQADTSTTRKYGGTGLGLSICKTLCEAMGGEIWVESEESVGSRFIFTIIFNRLNSEPERKSLAREINESSVSSQSQTSQLPEVSKTSPKVNSYSHLEKAKILVVDDNETNLLIVDTMLKKFGIQVLTAKNGEECMALLKETEVELILMDLQMPVMDGYQATQLIRQQPAMENLPIVAFSANVMDKDIARALAVGMNYHLAKPFSIIKLLDLISELLENKNNPAEGSTKS